MILPEVLSSFRFHLFKGLNVPFFRFFLLKQDMNLYVSDIILLKVLVVQLHALYELLAAALSGGFICTEYSSSCRPLGCGRFGQETCLQECFNSSVRNCMLNITVKS